MQTQRQIMSGQIVSGSVSGLVSFISVLSICSVVFLLSGCDRMREGTVAPGRPAPELDLVTLEGEPASLDQFRGKLVILNFLASWCEPCADEMPALQALADEMKDILTVVAVGIEDDDDALKEFRDRYKVRFPFLHNRSGQARSRYRVAGYPETFVLDEDGNFLMVSDPQIGGAPTLKFVGPRVWNAPQMKALLRAIKRKD